MFLRLGACEIEWQIEEAQRSEPCEPRADRPLLSGRDPTAQLCSAIAALVGG